MKNGYYDFEIVGKILEHIAEADQILRDATKQIEFAVITHGYTEAEAPLEALQTYFVRVDVNMHSGTRTITYQERAEIRLIDQPDEMAGELEDFMETVIQMANYINSLADF